MTLDYARSGDQKHMPPRDLHDLKTRRKLRFCSNISQIFTHRLGRRLHDLAASLADKKNYQILRAVTVATGEIAVARGETMDKAIVEQKIKRPID